MKRREKMLIHFLENYNITGKIGDKVKIRGDFPGINPEDYVVLNNDTKEEELLLKIEQIEYMDTRRNTFTAVAAAD